MGPRDVRRGHRGAAGLRSLVALSSEGQGLPPAHPSPHTCKKSHVSPGSCPLSTVGAGGLPPTMALSASTQSCSRGPTVLKSPAKGGSPPAPRLQAQQGKLRHVPKWHPFPRQCHPMPCAPLVGPGWPWAPWSHVHLPLGVPWLQEEQDPNALGCLQKAMSVPTGFLPPNSLATLWPTTRYLVGGLQGPSAVGLVWPPATTRPVGTRREQEGRGVGKPHGGARAGCW